MPQSALNAVYVPYLDKPQRYQLYYGGAASGKSAFIARRAVLDALTGRNTLVVRQVGRTLRSSCWNECIKAVTSMGLGELFRANKSDMTLTSVPNGAQLLFTGLDDAEKIKSITPQKGALTDIWLEEATEMSWTDVKQLDKRLRGPSRHFKRMTFTFNPIDKSHWLYQQFFEGFDEAKGVYEDADRVILRTTYRDNRFLTPDDIRALENEQDSYYRAVYTEGRWGTIGEAVLPLWRVEDLSAIEQTEEKLLFGLDFGFAADPCAAIKCAYRPDREEVLVFDELGGPGLTNDRLAELLRPFCRGHYITCDSAEPKSIAELRQYGIAALPAVKGPDSLTHSLRWLRGRTIVLSPKCRALKRELSLYRFRRGRDGEVLSVP